MTRAAFIASPYAADTPTQRTKHITYAKLAQLHAMVVHGETPYTPHLLLTLSLRDKVPAQRALGLRLAQAMLGRMDVLAAYADLGVSFGMEGEVVTAQEANIPVEVRRIFDHVPTYTEILDMIDALEARIA